MVVRFPSDELPFGSRWEIRVYAVIIISWFHGLTPLQYHPPHCCDDFYIPRSWSRARAAATKQHCTSFNKSIPRSSDSGFRLAGKSPKCRTRTPTHHIHPLYTHIHEPQASRGGNNLLSAHPPRTEDRAGDPRVTVSRATV